MEFSYWKNHNFLNLSIAAIAGVVIALSVIFIEPTMVLVLTGALLGGTLLVFYPEYGFIAILVLLSSILGEEQIPTIDVGLQIYISDLVFLLLLAIMVIRLLVDSDFEPQNIPLAYPLLIFWGFALVSTLIHIADNSILIGDGIQEMRIITYYLLVIPFTLLMRSKKQLDRFLDALFLLATLTAAANLIQYILGDSITFLTGRVEQFSDGVVRITDNPGEGIITTTFIVLTIRLFLSKFKFNNIFHFAQWAIIGAAMLISFNRTHWGVAGLSLVITFFLTNPEQRNKILSWGLSLLWLIPIAILPALIFRDSAYADLIDAAFVRIGSFFSSQSYVDPTQSTIIWRNFEYKYGLPQVAANPFMGLGMGAYYRPFIPQIDGWGSMGPHYTHNGHLWIAMKGGLLAWFSMIVFMLMFIVQGFKNWQKIADPEKQSLTLGFTLVAVSIILGSILHPIIITLFWTPLLGMIFAVNHVIFKLYLEEETKTQEKRSELIPVIR
jgi:hypothetical protein